MAKTQNWIQLKQQYFRGLYRIYIKPFYQIDYTVCGHNRLIHRGYLTAKEKERSICLTCLTQFTILEHILAGCRDFREARQIHNVSIVYSKPPASAVKSFSFLETCKIYPFKKKIIIIISVRLLIRITTVLRVKDVIDTRFFRL